MDNNKETIVETFITTYDNPFDPFTNFGEWCSYDCQLGYNTCQLIDRVYNAFIETNEIDEVESELLRVESMKRIVSLMPNVYRIIKKETFVDSIPLSNDDTISE